MRHHHFAMALVLATTVSTASAATETKGSIQDACRMIFTRRTTTMQQLAQRMPDAMRQKLTAPFPQILAAKAHDCQDSAKARSHIELVTSAIGNFTPKIGLILPFNNLAAEMKSGIVAGMEERVKRQGLKPSEVVVTKETMGGFPALEQRLAELFFIERAAIVVHYGSRAEQDHLAQWSSRLLMPVINLGINRQDQSTFPHAFYVWPNDGRLAEQLARYVTHKRYQRVAILRPTRQAGGQFIFQFTQALQRAGVDTSQQLQYAPQNFASMEATLRQLFKVGREGREEEFQEIFKKRKAEAEQAGLPLGSQEILLPPRVDVDAIYIGDNFRNVRHLVKIMKSLGVRSVPLLGNQEWRALDLIEPPESFLEGAVFVDFIGSYQNMPAGLSVVWQGSPYFIPPAESQRMDLKIIGYQAASAAINAVTSAEKKRHKLRDVLMASTAGGGYFGNGPMFDKRQQAEWPSFLLQVGAGRLDLVNLPEQTHQQATAPAPQHAP